MDMNFQIKLDTPEEVQDFVYEAGKCPFEIDLTSGNVFIDAKSYLGVLTMALHRQMVVNCIDVTDKRSLRGIQKFAVA